MRLEQYNPKLVFVTGTATGLLVGIGMFLGALTTIRSDSPGHLPLKLPQTLLHATASHGTEKFIAATGQIDQYAEGLFTLDALTGDLQCVVMNNRTGKFGAFYRTNVLTDLQVAGKKPQFVMVTGIVDFRSIGTARPAPCVAYVIDANTGRYAAYGIPLSGQTSRAAAVGSLVLLDARDARSEDVNE